MPLTGRQRAGLTAAVALGLAAGLGLFTFGYARGASYLTNDPAACANCHIMSEHFTAWQRGSHRAAATCMGNLGGGLVRTPHPGSHATAPISGPSDRRNVWQRMQESCWSRCAPAAPADGTGSIAATIGSWQCRHADSVTC